MVAFLFPGQGSQAVGMGRALAEAAPEAQAVFAEADDVLGFALSRVCFHGPAEELQRTEITQPAILATSIAALRTIQARQPALTPDVVAGHSLGEWSALVAVGAISLADALRSVHARGQLMQSAVPEGVGAMHAVIGLTAAQVTAICTARSTPDAVIEPANINGTSQIVVSGHAAALEAAADAFRAEGAKKVMPLAVSAPFHCSLMQPAADGLAEVLEEVTFSRPSAPVVTNVEGEPDTEASRIRALLVKQVTAPVRWVECALAVSRTATVGLEVGEGKVLKGLVRRIDKGLTIHPAGTPQDIDVALAALAGSSVAPQG